jgi:hypothetical protein
MLEEEGEPADVWSHVGIISGGPSQRRAAHRLDAGGSAGFPCGGEGASGPGNGSQHQCPTVARDIRQEVGTRQQRPECRRAAPVSPRSGERGGGRKGGYSGGAGRVTPWPGGGRLLRRGTMC